MTDFRLLISQLGSDFGIVGGDLALDRGLVTAILVSLFSDARAADDDELPDDLSGRGGWSGETPGDPWGSKLWLLRRSKLTPATLNAARDYVRDCLAWTRREGIADEVNVSADIVDGDLVLEIELGRGTSRRWSQVWEGTEAERLEAGGVVVEVVPS